MQSSNLQVTIAVSVAGIVIGMGVETVIGIVTAIVVGMGAETVVGVVGAAVVGVVGAAVVGTSSTAGLPCHCVHTFVSNAYPC